MLGAATSARGFQLLSSKRAGNDDYYVDNVNDVASETTVPGVDDGGTNDRVYSTVSYTLSPFIKRLVLLESAVAISATGNAQANSIVGNSNDNIISGGGGKGLDFARIAVGVFVTAQPYTVAVPLEAQAVAIVFDLVEPVWAGRDGLFRSLANKARNS
jgi:hypothetical protein